MERIVVREEPAHWQGTVIVAVFGLIMYLIMLMGWVFLLLIAEDTQTKQLMTFAFPAFSIVILWAIVCNNQERKINRLEFDPETGEMTYYRFLHKPFHFHRSDITRMSTYSRSDDHHIEKLLLEIGRRKIVIPLGITNARWERRVPDYYEKRSGAWENANLLAEYLDVYSDPEIAAKYTAEIPTIRIG